MPSVQGIPGFQLITSSANPVQGTPFTRLKGVALTGTIADSVSTGPGPIPPAGGFVCIQSTASVSNQIISTGAILNASLHYLAVTTASAVNMNAVGAPPFTGCGAAFLWNDNTKNLHIWSSGSSSWMAANLVTSGSTSGAAATAQPIAFTTS